MDLSVIVVSFNTKDITAVCLNHLKRNFEKYPLSYEIIVIDNGSIDGSKEYLLNLKSQWRKLSLITLNKNLGYTKANNLGLKRAQGRYLLFLNSDVFVNDLDFSDLIRLMEFDKTIGALTVKVNLKGGRLDNASHRSIPTLWWSFCYFVGLENLFRKIPILNRFFGGYHLVQLSEDEIHQVEAISGAFFFIRGDLIKKIGGFDEDYFAYGEDIELCFQIKKQGYKIFYYPLWTVVHLKHTSGLKNKGDKVRAKIHRQFYEAMKIFYKKHYSYNHPEIFNRVVYFLIDFLSKLKK